MGTIFSRVICLMVLLFFQAGYSTETDPGDKFTRFNAGLDSLDLEINPGDFVPLEVGNSWTYEHSYWNDSYPRSRFYTLEDLKPLEIPGYPHGYGNPTPPDSLTDIRRTLTIEITHTERIDGLEYFVFSGADYAWPPVPPFFWAGKKVRLSDEGILIFRWERRDTPWYDFASSHQFKWFKWYEYPVKFEYDEYPFVEFGYYQIDINRAIDIESPEALDQISRVSFGSEYPGFAGGWYSEFLPRYGLGECYILYLAATDWSHVLKAGFAPISATISGEEISYEQLTREDPPPPRPRREGVSTDSLRVDEGFDFSAPRESDFDRDWDYARPTDDLVVKQLQDGHAAYAGPPAFHSRRGLAALHSVDFESLISEGIPPDLRPDSALVASVRADGDTLWVAELKEGHTYAVWTHEGGVALLNVTEITTNTPPFDQFVRKVVFDWVYDPRGSSTVVEASVLGDAGLNALSSGLESNVPNPFNRTTRIAYRLATPGPVRLAIFNALGQPVRTLVDQVQAAGRYQVHWDGRDQGGAAVAAGVYFTRLYYPGGVQTRRLLYLK